MHCIYQSIFLSLSDFGFDCRRLYYFKYFIFYSQSWRCWVKQKKKNNNVMQNKSRRRNAPNESRVQLIIIISVMKDAKIKEENEERENNDEFQTNKVPHPFRFWMFFFFFSQLRFVSFHFMFFSLTFLLFNICFSVSSLICVWCLFG